MEKNRLYLSHRLFESYRAPGIVTEAINWILTEYRTTDNLVFPGTVMRLVGIEHSPVNTNYYFYSESKNYTVIMIDEFNDPNDYFSLFIINYNKIWEKLNV